jgi:CheY-like chemotaxis protein
MAHVMVVDDEADGREVVARFLARMGHQVSSAQDGRDALRKLMTDTPDALVLDMRMPGLDGVGLLEVMRAYLRWHDLPVIVVSAHARGDEITRASDMGVRHFLHKANYNLNELAAALDDALGQGEHAPMA